MVPDVVSVYFGLFRNTVESLSGSNCRLLASLCEKWEGSRPTYPYILKSQKKIFKIRIHKGGARLVLNSYVDVNLRKIVHVSLFFFKGKLRPHPLLSCCYVLLLYINCMHSYKGKYDFEVPWIVYVWSHIWICIR